MTQAISVICETLIALMGILFAYRGVYIVLGLFRTRKFSRATKQHKYAVLIAARNEDAVIGNLIDSIQRQNYPADLITTFVVADNCTDSTAAAARSHGAVCYERFNKDHCTKGFALDFLLGCIQKDYGIDSFDGYFIFDADNLLKQDYIRSMNDAFDAGEKIVTSYRNTKNFDSNFLSAIYALHWMRTARMESMARSYLGVSTRLQGCGYLVASDLLTGGWPHTSLTEDRAFSIDAVSRGIHISYQDEAEFYDEQPTTLPIVWRQRMRWSKGNLLAFCEYGGALLKNVLQKGPMKKKWDCFDMFMVALPYSLVVLPLKILTCVMLAIGSIQSGTLASDWPQLLLNLLNILVLEHFGTIPMALLLFYTERKRMAKLPLYKMLYYSLTFPLFSILGDLTLFACIFRNVTWKPIPHDAAIKIEEIEGRMADKELIASGSRPEQ